MSPNPYEPPTAFGPERATRTLFVLAAVGAWAASAYWAALTLMIGLGVATSSASPLQIVLPLVLIGLYAVRGFQVLKGQAAATTRLLWLHGVGGVIALTQVYSGTGILVVLQGIKVAIHVFGGVATYLARRALVRGA